MHAGWRLRHQTRPIDPVGLWTFQDWRIKAYAISGAGSFVRETMIARAKELAERHLPKPAITDERYGAGFAICHEAAAFDTITIDWWECTNELRHLVFRAAPGGDAPFENITARGEAACVWEIRIIAFEREAWLEHVLTPSVPDISGYLDGRLCELC